MTTPLAIYCQGQYAGARREDLEYEQRFGLLLQPVAWSEGSPVVTLAAFAQWIAAWAANDRNGNWGFVKEVVLAEGRYMVHISNDALHRGVRVHDGMTFAQVCELDSEISLWPVGDGGLYRLSDCPDWAEDWAPLTSFDQFTTH